MTGDASAVASCGAAVSATCGASVATAASVGAGGGAWSPQAARIKIAAALMVSTGSRGRVERRPGMVEPLRGRRADLPRSPGQRANGVTPCRHRTAMLISSQAASQTMSRLGAVVVAKRVPRYTFSRRCEAMAISVLGRVPEWLNGPDCKSGAKATVVRIRPRPPTAGVDSRGRCHGPT